MGRAALRFWIPLGAAAIACGARTPLDVGADASSAALDGGASLSCALDAAAPSRVPCSSWHVAGAEHVVAPPPSAGAGLTLAGVIASGCGVVAAWSTQSNGRTPTLSWSTRSIAFDGTPRSDVFDHPALTTKTNASGAISLATNGTNTGAVVADESGCRFAPLDAKGAGVGPPVMQGAFDCRALARDGDGFSYLTESAQSTTPPTLHRVDARGAAAASIALAVAPNRALWDRLVFDDGSFLLDTFREDPSTTVYTDWLQHFDSRGVSVASEITVGGANTAPVLLAKTATGALAAWQWSAVNFVAIDRDGHAVGPVRSIARSKPLYGLTLVPTPGGDVLLVWNEDGTGTFDVFAQAVAPDGALRGDATLVRNAAKTDRFYGVVDASGEHALLVFAEEGVKALPLDCAR